VAATEPRPGRGCGAGEEWRRKVIVVSLTLSAIVIAMLVIDNLWWNP